MKGFILATSMLAGTIIGLGMFGIPYTASKAGFFIAIAYIIILGAVSLLLHLAYGEVAERTAKKHRLTGYTELYLGKKWRNILGAAVIFSIYIALLAYIIVGGKFLSLIIQGFGSPVIFGLIFWFALSLLLWRGVGTIAWAELLMTGPLVIFIFFIFALGADEISFKNLTPPDFSEIFLPYGVVLFALSGSLAIPEIRDLLKVDGNIYKRVIITGSIIPVALYILFVFLVLGISGTGTSQEALGGLVPHLGANIIALGAVLGLLALSTSYLVLASNLKHTFQYDWGFEARISRVLATLVPALLFVAGFQQFITVISISGAVIGASIGIAILAIYLKAKKAGDKTPGYSIHLPRFVAYIIMLLFALGGVYEIIYLIW